MDVAGGSPGQGRVAGIARSRRDNVGGRLAGSGGAVTSGTGSGNDAGMVKRRRLPVQRPMAGIARSSCHRVHSWLAGGRDPVMAGGTVPGIHALVGEDHHGPTLRPVADVAVLDRLDVCLGDPNRRHPATRAVTSRAIARRAAEDPLDMAGFATCLDVLAGEGISGQGMIERPLGIARGLRQRGTGSEGEQHQ